ncbi:MAG: hypothetical protein ACE5F1_07740 [Planctomycetota bacterium]
MSDYLRFRGLDLADCFKFNIGAGLGLAVDMRATDYFAPGLGYLSYTANVGWDDRDTHGTWKEVVVVNTPRAVWEVIGSVEEERLSSETMPSERIARLALASVFLANERWIRRDETGQVTVELYSLFNFAPVSSFLRAADPGGYLVHEGETAELKEKEFWDTGWFEIGATAGFVHLRAGVNPLQMIDFACGLLGLDPAKDDRVLLR